MTSRKVKVVAGPSKWDLMISFFEQRRAVEFTAEDGKVFSLIVHSMYNDEWWNAWDESESLFLEQAPTDRHVPCSTLDDLFIYGRVTDQPTTLLFYYSTKTRTGVVRVVDQEGDGYLREDFAKRLTQHQL